MSLLRRGQDHRPLRNSIEKHSVGAGFYPARGRGRAPPLRTTRYASVGADAYIGPPGLIPHLLLTVSLRSRRVRRLWQSVLLWICTGVLRIPTTSLRTGLGMTGLLQGVRWMTGDGLSSARPPMAKFSAPSAPFYLYTGLYFSSISLTPPGELPEKFMRLSDFLRSDNFSSCRENFFVLCSV